ncbi:MAG: phasin family protein [Pseudomonadota bacterium]
MATKPTTRKPAAKKPAARKPAAGKAAPKPAAAKRAAPKPAQSTADRVRDTVTERLIDPARKAAENVRESIVDAGQNSAAFSMKIIEQAEHNAREAFNAMRAAAKSKDVSEVLRVQGDFLREQGSRSLAQAREIGDLIAQFGRDAIAPLTGGKRKN